MGDTLAVHAGCRRSTRRRPIGVVRAEIVVVEHVRDRHGTVEGRLPGRREDAIVATPERLSIVAADVEVVEVAHVHEQIGRDVPDRIEDRMAGSRAGTRGERDAERERAVDPRAEPAVESKPGWRLDPIAVPGHGLEAGGSETHDAVRVRRDEAVGRIGERLRSRLIGRHHEAGPGGSWCQARDDGGAIVGDGAAPGPGDGVGLGRERGWSRHGEPAEQADHKRHPARTNQQGQRPGLRGGRTCDTLHGSHAGGALVDAVPAVPAVPRRGVGLSRAREPVTAVDVRVAVLHGPRAGRGSRRVLPRRPRAEGLQPSKGPAAATGPDRPCQGTGVGAQGAGGGAP